MSKKELGAKIAELEISCRSLEKTIQQMLENGQGNNIADICAFYTGQKKDLAKATSDLGCLERAAGNNINEADRKAIEIAGGANASIRPLGVITEPIPDRIKKRKTSNELRVIPEASQQKAKDKMRQKAEEEAKRKAEAEAKQKQHAEAIQ